MIHDEDLRSSIDYSEGQKQAAHVTNGTSEGYRQIKT